MKKRLLILFMLGPIIAGAEVFLEVYGGPALVQDGSFAASENRDLSVSGGWLYSQGDLSGASGVALGSRGGYWLPGRFHWAGAAMDVNTYKIDADDSEAEVRVNSMSVMVLFRYPMNVSESFPHGRFQPYGGLGYSWALVDIEGPNNYAQGTADSDYSGVLCFGAKWMIFRKLGVFAEYRYQYVSFDHSERHERDDFFGNPHPRVFEAEGDLSTHQFFGGIAVHF